MPRVYPSQVRSLIAELFPFVVTGGDAHVDSNAAPAISAVASLVREIPSELLTLSAHDYGDFTLALGAMEHCLKEWQTPWDRVRQLRRAKDTSPIILLYRALSKCPDEAASVETTELGFVEDADLRASIRRDVSAAERDLINGEWKGATVLAGAAIEALLLWVLKTKEPIAITAALERAVAAGRLTARPRNPDPESRDWHLSQYIEAALELELITSDTATAARLTKDFRNLIHPGRAQRLGQPCDLGTAQVAIGAVNLVARDLAESA